MSDAQARRGHDDEGWNDEVLQAAFRAYAEPLYHYIYKKVRDEPLAEDLTSEVFLKALRWLEARPSAASIRGWLFATARTAMADHWRDHQGLTILPLETVPEVRAPGPTGDSGASDARDRLLPILRRLPVRERDVLTLRYLYGYSTGEMAQTLGLTPDNVRQIHHRALRHAARGHPLERSHQVDTHLDQLTEEGRRVLEIAYDEAVGFRHNWVGTEGLLLALLQGETLAARVLAGLGVEAYRIRGGITLVIGHGREIPSDVRLGTRAHKMIELAAEEARQLGAVKIGPEHLLLGLVREGQGIAAGFLETLNVPLARVREDTLKAITNL